MPTTSLRVLRGFTLYVNDNQNLYFEIEELKLPVLEEKTETFQPGGSDVEIAIAGLGTKELQLPFKTKSHSPEVIGLFGGPPGTRHDFTGAKLVVDEMTGEEHEHVVDVKGRLTKVDAEAARAGSLVGYDNMVGSIFTYTETWDGRVMHRYNLKSGGWDIWNFEPVNATRRRVLFA